jgi:hypothetical protein
MCYNTSLNTINVYSTEDYFNIALKENYIKSEQLSSTLEFIQYARTLYNSEDKINSKILLEEYARGFGIELSRNKKFSNMIIDLEKAFNEI